VKKPIGPKNVLYPLPVLLIGAMAAGRPTYTTIAHVGILDFETISLGFSKSHFINVGIKENRTFSVNFPTTEMVIQTDYCGMVSGSREDKARLFTTVYGELKTAPLIEECPLSMECRLVDTIDRPKHDVFIGEIVQTHCEESMIRHGDVLYDKIQPILFTMSGHGYWRLGERFATAWEIGRKLKR